MDLGPAQLRTRCDPAELGFARTDELRPRTVAVGQDRAVDAIRFAIGIKDGGFNLFVLGPTGSGRSRLAQSLIEQRAAAEPVPDDFCYVHNFEDPRRPRALRLAPGQGARLRVHMERLIEDLPGAITAAFEDQRYRERREAIENEIKQRHEQEMSAIAQHAASHGVAVLRTPTGVVLAFMRGGKVLEPDAVAQLSDEERTRLTREAEAIEARLQEALRRIPQLQREQRDRIRALDHEVTQGVARELLADARRAFGEVPQALEHLDHVERDIVGKASQVLRGPSHGEIVPPLLSDAGSAHDAALRRYRVNLSVVQLGEASFGFPTRITAQVRLGKGEVVDIQREVQLGGPIHSKGVLTLSAFLGGRYQTDKPLSLRATLVFEQVYGHVEGDSASLAELLALLSAIGKLPLAQGIAITGSVDQHGRVQAVGGVNEKIEGFFDVCRARGLDGGHGVIIPAANVKHLMLRQDVVSTVAEGRFHVWSAADVDQAVEVACGVPGGARTQDGVYPEGSANRRVEDALEALARAALDVARAAQQKP